jgi:AraC-like DNA-binding protein
MTILFERRFSDSPYIDSITQGYTAEDGVALRPAESNWHLIISKEQGRLQSIFTGPLPTAAQLSYTAGTELLWIRFALGTFMPHMPVRKFLDVETVLPEASSQSFWLKGSAWEFPNFENVETFIDRLTREELLVRDPLVSAVLDEDYQPDIPPRTLRHHFLQSTGLTQAYLRQQKRAQHAVTLLEQGMSILDTVFETGYFDQAHMTRSLKQFIGYTPAQIARRSILPQDVPDAELDFCTASQAEVDAELALA